MIVIDNIEQGTDEWKQIKCGIPSASKFDKITTTTGKRSTQRKKYMYELAGESITGQLTEIKQTDAMKRGTYLEPEARAYFEFIKNIKVDQVTCVFPDENKKYLCSPDGLINGVKEGLEIKCRNLAKHLEYIDKDKLPTESILQVQGSLAVTGYDAWWFMSYFPGEKPFIIRVERDEDLIGKIIKEVTDFSIELYELKYRLNKKLNKKQDLGG